MKKKLRIAVWSIGKHAEKNILPSLKDHPEIELVGIYSRNKIKVSQCMRKYECRSWNSSQEMLLDSNIDIIYASGPINSHYNCGLKTLKSNKHFWCEKPFTLNFKESETLVKLSKEKKLTVAEGLMYYYHPQFIWLKDYVKKKRNIRIINSRFAIPFSNNQLTKYKKNKLDISSSVLLDIGIYPISLMHKLINIDNQKIKILYKNLQLSSNSNSEVGAQIIFLYNTIVFNIFWGIGYSYKNEVEVLANNSSMITKKIFAKTDTYSSVIFVSDKSGKESKIEIKKSNHFVNMFSEFSKLVYSNLAAEKERKRILSLAALNDKVKKHSKNL